MNIILSNFYQNFMQNQFLIDQFYAQNIFIISGVYGNFPYSFFRSENNVDDLNNIALYTDMLEVISQYKKLPMIIFDYANPLIQSQDYYNRYCQIQMETFVNQNNIFVSVGKKDFAEYLAKEYPQIKLILNLDFMDFDKTINNIAGVISSDLTKLELIDTEIKIYRMELYNCINCNHKNACAQLDHKSILNYSINSAFTNNNCKNLQLLNAETIVNNFAEAEDANITAILFAPPKVNQNLYYEIIAQCFNEGDL